MATPEMLIQSVPVTIVGSNPGSARFNTFNPDGTPLDVHTGYTVDALQASPLNSVNQDHNYGTISAFSAAFDATGVTLSWTESQSATLIAALTALTNFYTLFLSNDAGTTHAICSQGTLQINNNNSQN